MGMPVSTIESLEDHLRSAPVLYYYVPVVGGGGGHAQKYGAVLEGPVTVFVKPECGMAEGNRAVRYELAAWTTVKLLGWTDMMGATVFRSFTSPSPHQSGPAAAQLMWSNAQENPPITAFSENDIWRAATFDHLIQESDRVGHNWLGVSDGSGGQMQLKLIDHGFAFGWQPAGSSFVDAKRGQAIPLDVLAGVQTLVNRCSDGRLGAFLEAPELADMLSRAALLLSSGSMP